MQAGRFWFHTIALGVSAAVLFALAIAAITGTAALAFGQAPYTLQADFVPNSADVQTLTGVLTDHHCSARHPSDSGLSAADCARICVKRGSSWALVDGDKVYVIKGDSPYLDKFAGQRVRVLGTLEGSTLTIRSLEAATP